jgi:hypothetical protein
VEGRARLYAQLGVLQRVSVLEEHEHDLCASHRHSISHGMVSRTARYPATLIKGFSKRSLCSIDLRRPEGAIAAIRCAFVCCALPHCWRRRRSVGGRTLFLLTKELKFDSLKL